MNSFLHCREHDSLPKGHIGGPLDFLHSGGGSFLFRLGSILQGGGESLVLFRGHGAEEIPLPPSLREVPRRGGGSVVGGSGHSPSHARRRASPLREGAKSLFLLLHGTGSVLEFHLGPVGGLVQGTQNTIVDAVENGLLVEKFHLGFGRMHIHIQGVGR